MTLHTQFLYAYLVVVVMYYKSFKLNMLTSSLQVYVWLEYILSVIFSPYFQEVYIKEKCVG